MKILHTSDLHIGKKLNGFSLLEDQKYILAEILKIAEEEKADALIISGDIYDKPIPSAESVRLLGSFLTDITKLNIPAFIISGNHDSAERLSFASDLIKTSNIYISPVFSGKIEPITLNDAYGEICIYMLPFIKPAHINHISEIQNSSLTVTTYDQAVNTAINNYMEIDISKRNIILSHQFVTGAKTCDSEEMTVGGTENISSENFSLFDYAALGHIHTPQNVSDKKYRHSGTPLKYSFSEARDKKTVTLIELKEKGNINIYERELKPLRDMRIIEGLYSDIVSEYTFNACDDYIKIVLKDDNDIPDAMGKLRSFFPNLMNIEYSNNRTKTEHILSYETENAEKISDIEMLELFYELQNNEKLTCEQKKLAEKIFEEIQEDEYL